MPSFWCGCKVRPDWGFRFNVKPFVTAIWKVYSVIDSGVLLENSATRPIESSERREAFKTILIEVLDTRTSLVCGKLGSSGSADANSQSSLLLLLLAPLVPCSSGVALEAWVRGAAFAAAFGTVPKLNIDGEGDDAFVGAERAEKGSALLWMGLVAA